MKTLSELLSAYPLPRGWSPPEVHESQLFFEETSLFLLGLQSTKPSGEAMFSAAASLEGYDFTRAYFELVERVSILEAEAASVAQFDLNSAGGEKVGAVSRAAVFPASPHPERWRFAKSNGVAAHATFKAACERAEQEILERHAVLSSWFGGIRPRPIAADLSFLPRSLRNTVDFKVYQFRSLERVEFHHVIGVFASRRTGGSLRAQGFAARPHLAATIHAAAMECLQALGFLWDEVPCEEAKAVIASPAYHQDRYLRPESAHALDGWFLGKNEIAEQGKETVGAVHGFVDLTPTHLRGKLAVVKAISPEYRQLFFGIDEESFPPQFPQTLRIHPFA